MRFVARVADNAPDKIEHQWFKIEKWPTIVRIRLLGSAILMNSNGSGRQCSGKIERRGWFWSFFTHFFTFFICERVSFLYNLERIYWPTMVRITQPIS